MDSKNAALSKTIIGVLITLAGPYLAKFGIVDGAGFADEIVSLIGTALAIYGRFSAKTTLTVLPVLPK